MVVVEVVQALAWYCWAVKVPGERCMESNQVQRLLSLHSPDHHLNPLQHQGEMRWDNMIVTRTRDNAPIRTIKCLNQIFLMDHRLQVGDTQLAPIEAPLGQHLQIGHN